MADTRRYSVIKAIQAQLQTITVANGYPVDLGGRVYLGRVRFGAETAFPLVSLWEPFSENGPDRSAQAGHTRRTPGSGQAAARKDLITVRYYLQGVANASTAEPTQNVYPLLGAIQQCLGPYLDDNQAFGAAGIELGHGIVRPPDNLSDDNPYCLVTLDIQLSETRGNPYV